MYKLMVDEHPLRHVCIIVSIDLNAFTQVLTAIPGDLLALSSILS